MNKNNVKFELQKWYYSLLKSELHVRKKKPKSVKLIFMSTTLFKTKLTAAKKK